MMQSLNSGESGLEAVPLSLEFFAAVSDGDGVFECGVIGPELEFCKRGAPGEEVEDRAYDGLLTGGEGDA